MTLEPARVRAILFDIDGTLSDTDDELSARVAKMLSFLSVFGNSQTPQRAARWLVMAGESPGNMLYGLFDRFDLDSLVIKVLNILSRHRKNKKRNFWLIPGVKETLTLLSPRYKMGVVSARDGDSTHAFLDAFDLHPFFSTVVTSQTCRYTKPFPDPILKAASDLETAPEACLMVGDTSVDMKAAKLAGTQTAAVLCGFGHRRELQRAGADIILNSPTDLPTLLGVNPAHPV